jgi:TRAP-type C4-dicarboxylate transport system permease small subunit
MEPVIEKPSEQKAENRREGLVEKICGWLSALALVATVAIVGTDIVTRSLFRFSFQIADEVAGYMLVAMAFLSLAVCQANDSFHRVEFFQAMLTPRGRALSRVIFDLLTLAVSAILIWQLGRFEIASWNAGSKAATLLGTPLWLPQSAMVIGMTGLAIVLVRTLVADLRALRTFSGKKD